MPELPEVETIRRRLAPHVVGRRVVDAGAFPSGKFTPALETTGARLVALDRRGKYLVGRLDDGRDLVVHLGMTGGLHVRAGADTADPYRRAWWTLDDGRTLEYRDVRRFGRIHVTPAGDHSSIPTLSGLGPEPLGPDFAPDAFHAALAASRRRLKTQLLGQRAVAGVGNIYADEALWRARANPATRRVSRPAALRLHAALRTVLADAIDHGGTTVRDYRTPGGGLGGHQAFLACYGRAGAPCLRCGARLRRRVVDARGTTWCPVCQRR